jgi:hypothetical protein
LEWCWENWRTVTFSGTGYVYNLFKQLMLRRLWFVMKDRKWTAYAL